MPNWTTFAGVTAAILAALLLLAHASKGATTAASDRRERQPAETGPDRIHAEATDGPTTPGESHAASLLLANVALSQALFGVLLVAGAWYARIPAAALGVTPATESAESVVVGAVIGAALYVANEASMAASERLGAGAGVELRAALAPASAAGWAGLLVVVLPVIAVVEELLFRGAVIGATSAGFGLSPWPLAVLSAVAFAAGHGAQGRVGVVVTGGLGFALAGAFVLTESLLTVVVAHYVVNALEFVVHEGPWTGERRG